MKRFEDVRNWSAIRGIGADESMPIDRRLQSQYQRTLQECIEIHDALVKEDWDEFDDAVGDTIVTLINIAKMRSTKAEDCLEKAFGVIELRKGLISPTGDFVRYAKLNADDQKICDEKQGNPGNQYFLRENLPNLSPESFKRD